MILFRSGKRLGCGDRIRRTNGGDKRVRLESPRRRAHPVLDRFGLTTEFGRPLPTPHRDWGEFLLQHPKDLIADVRVCGQHIGTHRQCPDSRCASHHRHEPLVQVECRGAENRKRAYVTALCDQHVDVPPRPCAVAQPSARRLHDVLGGGGYDIELVPENPGRACEHAIGADTRSGLVIGDKGSGCHGCPIHDVLQQRAQTRA